MKTRTKIIWICLDYLIWVSFAIYRIVQFINGRISVLDLIIGLMMCISFIYLTAYYHHRLLKENKEE